MTIKPQFDHKAAVAADIVLKLLAQEYLLYPYPPKCLYFIPNQILNCVKWNYEDPPTTTSEHDLREWSKHAYHSLERMVFPVCISNSQIQWYSQEIISLKESNIECLQKKGSTKKNMVNSSLNTYAMHTG
jgi:hypothetical protein